MSNKSIFASFWRDFISEEQRDFRVRIGYTLASSLFGFVGGIILSSIIWLIVLNYLVDAIKNIYLGL